MSNLPNTTPIQTELNPGAIRIVLGEIRTETARAQRDYLIRKTSDNDLREHVAMLEAHVLLLKELVKPRIRCVACAVRPGMNFEPRINDYLCDACQDEMIEWVRHNAPADYIDWITKEIQVALINELLEPIYSYPTHNID